MTGAIRMIRELLDLAARWEAIAGQPTAQAEWAPSWQRTAAELRSLIAQPKLADGLVALREALLVQCEDWEQRTSRIGAGGSVGAAMSAGIAWMAASTDVRTLLGVAPVFPNSGSNAMEVIRCRAEDETARSRYHT